MLSLAASLLLFRILFSPAADDIYPASNYRTDSLRILTYNLLASPEESTVRGKEILSILQKSGADIFFFQEAAPWFLEELAKEEWAENFFQTSVLSGFNSYKGLFVLSKAPISASYHSLPGFQKRKILFLRTVLNGEKTVFVNAHLESPLEDNWTRALQLWYIFLHVKSVENLFLLGDFNFGDGEEPESSILPEELTDVWLKLNPGQDGFTWDMQNNSLAVKNAYPREGSRRLDRILLKSKIFQPCGIEFVGDAEIAPGLFPSDHYGLLATFGTVCGD